MVKEKEKGVLAYLYRLQARMEAKKETTSKNKEFFRKYALLSLKRGFIIVLLYEIFLWFVTGSPFSYSQLAYHVDDLILKTSFVWPIGLLYYWIKEKRKY